MASELKRCPLCSADPSSKFTDIKAAIWCEPCGLHMEYSTAMVSLRIAEEHQRSILTKRWNTRPTPVAPVSPEPAGEPFQNRVKPWMLACFGEEISNDKLERCDRFIEEALELVQSIGYSPDRARALVDYVFNREIGEPHQEVGGVMVTLAALCLASDLDMAKAGEDELARIWTKVEKIRAKQAAKPTGSALPVAVSPDATGKCGELVTVAWKYRWKIDGEFVNWRYSDASQKHPLLTSLEEIELCTRSQAEELLVAERAENTRLQSENDAQADQISELQMTPWPEWATKVLAVIRKRSGYDGYGDAIEGVDLPAELDECIAAIEADNAALTARVKELEQINAVLMGDDEDKPRYTTKRLKQEVTRATEALEAKLTAAEKFIQFCADGFFVTDDELRGAARAALGGKPS